MSFKPLRRAHVYVCQGDLQKLQRFRGIAIPTCFVGMKAVKQTKSEGIARLTALWQCPYGRTTQTAGGGSVGVQGPSK